MMAPQILPQLVLLTKEKLLLFGSALPESQFITLLYGKTGVLLFCVTLLKRMISKP
ncbi:MAG: Uncharacterised protein [Porticoccaceae bacterium UBA1117]|nr:MAG: Uncharacterised protein [Porticoccaceae bacterium UBA1117]